MPYPEGTACAEVLVASEVGGTRARNVFLGLAAGFGFKFMFGWLKVLPAYVKVPVPGLLKAKVGMSMSAGSILSFFKDVTPVCKLLLAEFRVLLLSPQLIFNINKIDNEQIIRVR